MTPIRYLLWALSILFGFAVVVLLDKALSGIRNKWMKALIFIVRFLAMTGLGFELIADASPFLWKYAYPLMGIYIALFADCLCDIVLLILSFFKGERKKGSRTALLAAILLVLSVYGTVTSQNIRTDHLRFSSDKLGKDHRFVFLSDLHYGSSQTEKSFLKALEDIKAASPEFVLLGGDICDEHTEKEEMEWVFEQFGKLDIPVYYIYGNHDRQDRGDYVGGKHYREEEFEQAVLKNGVIILKDSFVPFGDDLILMGREDESNAGRLPVDGLPARPEGAYVINVDHSPYQNEDILATRADLQLSGHTHAGQIFPMRWLYTLAGLNVVYTYKLGDTDLYVSPGIGNWYYPFRNETHCSYAVIDLVKE
ncbi:MAG: metallophosphoesterase [Erysipelotrichaceae bacterium]|nr:metallophosphoesterase [Erysipelotrichaceae bacterium]